MRTHPQLPVRIGLALRLDREFHRFAMSGAIHHARTVPHREIALVDLNDPQNRRSPTQPVDGWIVMASLNESSVIDLFPQPKIVVSPLSTPCPYICVASHSPSVGMLAGEHLRSLGLNRFALCRHGHPGTMTELTAGFRKVIAQDRGARIVVHDAPSSAAAGSEWIASLPRPCGILASHDRSARDCISWIQQAGYRVPDDFAVIGIGNDMILTMVDQPTITSVELPAEAIGRQAVQLLDNIVRGESVASVSLPPVKLIPRESTQKAGCDDPIVADAMRLIASLLEQPLDTRQIADRLRISRRTLEYRFRRSLGRGVHEELIRQRLHHALHMLTTSTAPIKQVALAVGICHMTSFNRFIRQHTGLAPTDYRAQHTQTRQGSATRTTTAK